MKVDFCHSINKKYYDDINVWFAVSGRLKLAVLIYDIKVRVCVVILFVNIQII